MKEKERLKNTNIFFLRFEQESDQNGKFQQRRDENREWKKEEKWRNRKKKEDTWKNINNENFSRIK